MCNGWGEGRVASGLGVAVGAVALTALVTGFVTNVWLYTKEPVSLLNNQPPTTVTFKIGFWRVCPALNKGNFSARAPPAPTCAVVKYSSWEEMKNEDIGIQGAPLEFTPSIVTKIRVSMPFAATSVVLLILATLLALVGHCNNDHKTLIACALYTIAGLSLASGLVMFASVVSEVYLEGGTTRARFQYRYGWSFVSAGASLVLSELAGALCMTAYLGQPGPLDGPAPSGPKPDVAVAAGPTACHSCRKEAERATLRPPRRHPHPDYAPRYATLATPHHPPLS